MRTSSARSHRARIARVHSAARARYSGSGAEHMWRRLSAMDFINRGMLLSAVLLLCFVPLMISLKAIAGRSVVDTTVRRFGLNHEAAADLTRVLTSPSATSSAMSGLSYVFFIFS